MPADAPDPGRLRTGLGRLPLIGSILASPAFRDADFRRLSCGVAFNNAGMSGEHVVLGILVFQLTQSTAWVGVTLALYYFPMLIFGLLSGAIADWLDRRTLLRCLEAAIAATQVAFAVLIATGIDDLWLILAFTATVGSLRAMYQPAVTTSTKALSPRPASACSSRPTITPRIRSYTVISSPTCRLWIC